MCLWIAAGTHWQPYKVQVATLYGAVQQEAAGLVQHAAAVWCLLLASLLAARLVVVLLLLLNLGGCLGGAGVCAVRLAVLGDLCSLLPA
jgi:hypothetical protein